MKKVIAILMMLGLVNTANAAYTDISCDCNPLVRIFSSKSCQCRVDTDNPNVLSVCKAGARNRGYEVVEKGNTRRVVKKSAIFGATVTAVAFLIRCIAIHRDVIYNYANVILNH